MTSQLQEESQTDSKATSSTSTSPVNKPSLHKAWIDPHALGIVKALQKGGYTTYLVGGCVRDLLIGITPKDFDIATSAPPQKVKKQVYQSYIIGKRFRLVLVKRDDHQYEVATFRKQPPEEDIPDVGPILEDNLFGSPKEDATRRDFTINGLFYDPVKEDLIDYNEGLRDIQLRMIRMIGDPYQRLEEDPIRILRALRLAHKIQFSIEPELREAMQSQAETLKFSVLPRKREELLKILRLAHPELAFAEAFDLDVLRYVIPSLHDVLMQEGVAEAFFNNLKHYLKFRDDLSDNIQIFGLFLYAIFRTLNDEIPEKFPSSNHFLEDDFYSQIMRDELGMFKYEQQSVARAIQLLNVLDRLDSFNQRTPSRQLALLKNEGFCLALQFAEADCLIHPRKLNTWHNLYNENIDQISSIEDEKAKRRKKKRKKKYQRSSR